MCFSSCFLSAAIPQLKLHAQSDQSLHDLPEISPSRFATFKSSIPRIVDRVSPDSPCPCSPLVGSPLPCQKLTFTPPIILIVPNLFSMLYCTCRQNICSLYRIAAATLPTREIDRSAPTNLSAMAPTHRGHRFHRGNSPCV